MRLLFIVFNQVCQGTYWRAFHLGRYLTRRGHSVDLVATSRQRHLGVVTRLQEGIRIVEMPDLFHGSLRSGWDPWNGINRIAWLRGRSYDLVHAFESRPTVIFPALSIVHRQQIPLVMDWCDWFGRGGSVEQRPNPILRTLLRPVETFFEEHYRTQATGATVICTTLKEKAIALGVPAEQILMLSNGADPEWLQPLSMEDSREILKIPPGIPIIGHVGSIFRRDADLMAQAFDQVCEQSPSARLLLIGRIPFDFRPLVRHPNNILQTGFLDERQLNLYLATCDLFWLPLMDSQANRGRFPLKLTDYLSIGRPIVATPVGDMEQYYEGASFGLLAPPNPQRFAETTLLLLNDPGLRQEMGKQALEAAQTRFHWSSLAEKLERFYHDIQMHYNGTA